MGELPEEGTAISLNGFIFTVEEVEANRLKTLVVREQADENRVPPDESEAPAKEEDE